MPFTMLVRENSVSDLLWNNEQRKSDLHQSKYEMNTRNSIFLFLILCIAPGCHHGMDCHDVADRIEKEMDAGNLTRVLYLADSVVNFCHRDNMTVVKADSLLQIAYRIAIEFSVTEDSVINKLKNTIGPFSEVEKVNWENKGWLEFRIIDGKKMYFRRAVPNLILLRKFHEQNGNRAEQTVQDPETVFRLKHTEEVCRLSDVSSKPVAPVNFGITYTITVDPDAVPDGETIRCWLPWPKANHPRQKNIVLIGTSSPEYLISPDSAIHSSIYMQAKAKKGVPTVFRISYRYQSSAQHFNIYAVKIAPYDRE